MLKLNSYKNHNFYLTIITEALITAAETFKF